MMLNIRSLNRYRRKVDYVCSLRMMLNISVTNVLVVEI